MLIQFIPLTRPPGWPPSEARVKSNDEAICALLNSDLLRLASQEYSTSDGTSVLVTFVQSFEFTKNDDSLFLAIVKYVIKNQFLKSTYFFKNNNGG